MGAPDSCGCRIRDNMMLLSLTLAAVASLASSESGISYTAEPFKADQQQLAHITYTAEPFKTEFKPINSNAAIQPFTTYASLPRTYTYQHPISYNSFINPTSYPTAYTVPYTSSYMHPTRIQPSTYTYTTHLSNFGLCLNNLGAQVPC